MANSSFSLSSSSPPPALDADQQTACTAFLSRLVRTPSLSGQEAAVARQVADEMRACGFRNVQVDRIGNVIGRYGRPGGPILLLNAHMDTVDVADPASWQHDPFGAEIENGLLFGRGSADMKGALAAMVYGIGLLCQQQADLPGEVVLAAVVQEEPTEGMAMRSLLQHEGIRPDWVILGEPTNLQLARGHRGRVELHVTVFGRSAHASAPETGDNALTNAARLIFGLELQNASLMSDPVLGKATLAVTGINTLTASRNAIPDRCELIIDRRLTLGETPTRAVAEIESVMQRERVRGTVAVGAYRSVSYTGYESSGSEVYPAWLLPADHPLLQQSFATLERCLGRRPTVGIWAFSTDGVFTMGEAGIPTLGFGPGDARSAHTANESIRLSDVHQAADAYASLTIDLLDYLWRRP